MAQRQLDVSGLLTTLSGHGRSAVQTGRHRRTAQRRLARGEQRLEHLAGVLTGTRGQTPRAPPGAPHDVPPRGVSSDGSCGTRPRWRLTGNGSSQSSFLLRGSVLVPICGCVSSILDSHREIVFMNRPCPTRWIGSVCPGTCTAWDRCTRPAGILSRVHCVGGFNFSSKKARTRSTPSCWRCSVRVACLRPGNSTAMKWSPSSRRRVSKRVPTAGSRS